MRSQRYTWTLQFQHDQCVVYLQLKAKNAELQQQLEAAGAESQRMVSLLQEDMLKQLKGKQNTIEVLEARAARMLDWGVGALTSRNNAIVLREAMAAWRGRTVRRAGKHARERKLQGLARRLLQARLLRAWNSWRDAVEEARAVRATGERVVRRLLHRRVGSAFQAWQVRAASASESFEGISAWCKGYARICALLVMCSSMMHFEHPPQLLLCCHPAVVVSAARSNAIHDQNPEALCVMQRETQHTVNRVACVKRGSA